MSKISRYDGDVKSFGINSTSTYRTVFNNNGVTTPSTYEQSDTLDDNLNAYYLSGWESATSATKFPSIQDFNAMAFTLGQLHAYTFQQGVPEWNTSQNYFINSVAKGSDGNLYVSLTGTDGSANTGNDPVSDTTNWAFSSGQITRTGTTTGSASAYLLDATPSITAYATHQRFTVKANHENTGAATINVDSLGAVNMYKNVSSALSAGDIPVNAIIDMVYDGSNMQILNISSDLDTSRTDEEIMLISQIYS